MYDIIGDIHGHVQPLRALLEKMGYQQTHGIYQHAERTAIFVGDLIDRGPEQVAVFQLVRDMVTHGAAKMVMGNHELNAVLWTLPNPNDPTVFLRPHTPSNLKQHQAFLAQVGENSELHQDIIAWFKTLPLWLDLPELRVIHACWLNSAMQTLENLQLLDENHVLRDLAAWQTVGKKGSHAYEATEQLLKGIEVGLPEGMSFLDKDAEQRHEARVKWWLPATQNRLSQLALGSHAFANLEDDPILDVPRYTQQKPLFVGHYWLKDQPAPLSTFVACTDYSVAAHIPEAKLVAYRYQGETPLRAENFIWVSAH